MDALKVIVSAPSGGGKTTLIKMLLERLPGGVMSVSHTTRTPRPGEVHGKDYYFVSEEEFMRMVHDGAFAEWARVHDHMYGTSKREVERLSKNYRYVVFEIDCQGAASLRKVYPEAIDVFILPPSMGVLRERLVARGTEDPTSLQIRLADAKSEIARAVEYQYVLVNDRLEEAADALACIVETGLRQTKRFISKIKGLLEEL